MGQSPPFATIVHDQEAILEAVEAQGSDFMMPRTPELMESIEMIGNLPYVRMFDYAFMSYDFFSYDLNLINDKGIYLEAGFLEDDIDFLFDRFATEAGMLHQFRLKGVRHHEVVDVMGGAITLVAGRVFTEEEISSDIPVALIPQEFAQGNDLDVGDTFELSASVYLSMRGIPGRPEEFQEDDLLIDKPISFEVIGIFTPNIVLDESDWLSAANYRNFNNRIYVPLSVAKVPDNLFSQYLLEATESRRLELLGWEIEDEYLLSPVFDYEHLIFILDDPLDLEAFAIVASELLPEFFLMDDLTNGISDIIPSLIHIQSIAIWIIVGAGGAILLILGLLAGLYFRDRRHEIGIYLALGEKRLKIISRLLLEMVFLSHPALLFAFLTGYGLANQASRLMLHNHLLSQVSTMQNRVIGGLNDFNQMELAFSMSIEELMEIYSLVLNGSFVLIVYLLCIEEEIRCEKDNTHKNDC